MATRDNIESPEVWARHLWNYFIPFIGQGGPFYLTVDERLISELSGHQSSDPADSALVLNAFNLAANSLITKEGTGVALKRAELTKLIDGKFSCAIVLAVQQVLAVEQMLRDEAYSEHSYFPRYRTLLGLNKEFGHSNPFSVDDFRLIWDTLRSELLSIEGSSPTETITFFEGLGREKNRQLPLSQALLTIHDLEILRTRLGPIGEKSDDALFQLLVKHKGVLGTRSYRLLHSNNIGLIKRICAQVRAYFKNPSHYTIPKLPRVATTKYSGGFIGFRDLIGLTKESFTLYFKTTSGDTFLDERLQSALSDSLKENEVLILHGSQDGFREITNITDTEPIESIFIVFHSTFRSELLERTKEIIPSEAFNKNPFLVFHIPKGYDAVYVDSIPREQLLRLIGTVPDQVHSKTAIELMGGILVDARNRTYLTGYPPTGVKIKERALSDNETIKFNGEDISTKDFFDRLQTVENFAAFQIEINNIQIEFSISREKIHTTSTDKLGFRINQQGNELWPQVLSVGEEINALLGTVFLNANASHLKREVIAAILNRKGRQISLTQQEVELLSNHLEGFVIEPTYRSSIYDILKTNMTIRRTPETLALLTHAKVRNWTKSK